jgi:hypothetical protein
MVGQKGKSPNLHVTSVECISGESFEVNDQDPGNSQGNADNIP